MCLRQAPRSSAPWMSRTSQPSPDTLFVLRLLMCRGLGGLAVRCPNSSQQHPPCKAFEGTVGVVQCFFGARRRTAFSFSVVLGVAVCKPLVQYGLCNTFPIDSRTRKGTHKGNAACAPLGLGVSSK